jgi:hypothetical protein
MHSRRNEVQKAVLNGGKDISVPLTIPVSNQANEGNFVNPGSFSFEAGEGGRQFMLHCKDLEKYLCVRCPDLREISELKRRIEALEASLVVSLDLPASIHLDLWLKANSLVRKRLRAAERIRRQKEKFPDYTSQRERLPMVKRTYSSRRSLLSSPECPFDEGFYELNRLLNELVANRTLPGNLFHVSHMSLTDGHLEYLGQRSRFDLERICRLDLEGNQLSITDPICQLISHSRYLLFVNLRGNQFSAKSIPSFFHPVMSKVGFVGIDLRSNPIDTRELKSRLILELERCSSEHYEEFKMALGKVLIDKHVTCLDLLE